MIYKLFYVVTNYFDKLRNKILTLLINYIPFKKKFIFIHIGKCGGTSLSNLFKSNYSFVKIYHEERPQLKLQKNRQYFFVVRNPLRRFVSAFNYSKSIIEFDIRGLNIDNLTLNNTPAPYWIR